MKITSEFDAGNIRVINSDNKNDIQLAINNDNESEFYQWFYFRVSGVRDQECCYRIMNAAGAAYPAGFSDYRVVYSYDRKDWLRHETTLQDGVMSFRFTAQQDAVYFAYFAPYSMEQHHELIAGAQASTRVRHYCLGSTVDGQDMDLLHISSNHGTDAGQELKANAGKLASWIIARQHPGETMAQWWMEGCVEQLLDKNNDSIKEMLDKTDVFLVANMNPDGSRRGHLRTNAAGRNLNREWAQPTLEHSPEVYVVREAMNSTGVDFFLDVHGDESLPYCFIAGVEGLKDWDERKQNQLDFYKQRLAELNKDFQTKVGYPVKPKGEANLTMSTGQTAANHGCLAMTLEMPFKDATGTPDPQRGWSPTRSKRLAHSCLQVMDEYLNSPHY